MSTAESSQLKQAPAQPALISTGHTTDAVGGFSCMFQGKLNYFYTHDSSVGRLICDVDGNDWGQVNDNCWTLKTVGGVDPDAAKSFLRSAVVADESGLESVFLYGAYDHGWGVRVASVEMPGDSSPFHLQDVRGKGIPGSDYAMTTFAGHLCVASTVKDSDEKGASQLRINYYDPADYKGKKGSVFNWLPAKSPFDNLASNDDSSLRSNVESKDERVSLTINITDALEKSAQYLQWGRVVDYAIAPGPVYVDQGRVIKELLHAVTVDLWDPRAEHYVPGILIFHTTGCPYQPIEGSFAICKAGSHSELLIKNSLKSGISPRVMVDLAGRFRFYGHGPVAKHERDRGAIAATLASATDLTELNTTLMSLQWETLSQPTSSMTPSGAFAVAGNDASEENKRDVYEFTFYCTGHEKHLGATVSKVGTVEVQSGEPQTLKTIGQTAGYFDSIIPIPIQNHVDQAEGSFGTFTFAQSTGKENAHSVDLSMKFGVKGSFETTGGIGPAMEASFNSGPNFAKKSINTSQNLDSMSSTAKFVQRDKLTAFATRISRDIVFTQTNIVFTDVDNKIVTADDSPYSMIQVEFGEHADAHDFTPFLCDPTDFESYTSERINKRAQEIGLVAGSTKYVEDVLDHCVKNGGKKLHFSSSTDGGTGQKKTAMKEDFTEVGWSMDYKYYAGVSGGGGIDFYGLAATVSLQLLAGVEINAAYNYDTSSQSGIELAIDGFNPPPGKKDSDIEEYAFDAYFLEANEQWRIDLKKGLEFTDQDQVEIDPGSKPWRVVFVVTYYKKVDGTIHGTK